MVNMICMEINMTAHIKNEQAYIRATEQRIAANGRKGRRARWFAANANAQRCEEFLLCFGEFYDDHPVVRASAGDFRQSLLDSLNEWGALTDNQTAAVIKLIERSAQRVAEREERKQAQRDASKHVGSEGERRAFDLTITFKTGFETQYGWTTVLGLTDADGNDYIYKGAAALKNADGSYDLAAGDRVLVTATIAHGERDGVKQTLLKRPKQK